MVSVTASRDRMRIGVMFRCATPAEELPEFARRTEAAGFDELWVVEDCFYSGGVAAAAAALAATTRVDVGIGILPLHVAGADSVCLIPTSDHEEFFTQSAAVLAELEDASR